MRTEKEIREELERLEQQCAEGTNHTVNNGNSDGEDLMELLLMFQYKQNILKWVLNEN